MSTHPVLKYLRHTHPVLNCYSLYSSDQNPIKGSRASMNFSDKPMESDTGSLDEYGDVDPGRYNEDGSFIGQYGQGGPPSRHQADV